MGLLATAVYKTGQIVNAGVEASQAEVGANQAYSEEMHSIGLYNKAMLAKAAKNQSFNQGKTDNAEGAPQQSPAPAAGGRGTIYRVPGSGTPSGKPYLGRHNKGNPAKTRRSTDGRDRKQAEVVDTYDLSTPMEGRTKEQQQIDKEGLPNLDNKRNEIRKDKKD